MVFLLRVRGNRTRGYQACSKHKRAHAHRVANFHRASICWVSVIVWSEAGGKNIKPGLRNALWGWTESGLHRVVLVFCVIDVLPFTAVDSLADLRVSLSFA